MYYPLCKHQEQLGEIRMEYTFEPTEELWHSWLLAIYTGTKDGRKKVWHTCIKACLVFLSPLLIVFLLDKRYAIELLGLAVIVVLIKSKFLPFAWVAGRMAMKQVRPNGMSHEVFRDPTTITLTKEGISTSNRYERREVQWCAGVRAVCSDALCVFLLGDQVVGFLPRAALESSKDWDELRAWCANILIIPPVDVPLRGGPISVVNVLALAASGFACMAIWVVPVARILTLPIGIVGLVLGGVGLFAQRDRLVSLIAIVLSGVAILAELGMLY